MATLRINAEAWTAAEDGSALLCASRCKACGQTNFPPLERCPACWGEQLERAPIAGPGTLYSFTVIHQKQKGLPLPYVVGYIDFPQGIRAFGVIAADPAHVAIGMKLKVMQLPLQDDAGTDFGTVYCFQAAEGGAA